MQNRIFRYFSIFTGLGLVYLIKSQLQKRSKDESKYLSRELTLKIVQEIKYHMLVVCIQFARKVDGSLKKALKPAQMDKISKKLKDSVYSFYSQKEEMILGKYQIEKQLYGESLLYFQKDPQLKYMKQDMLLMMQRAMNGDLPSLAVPQQATNLYNCNELINVYREMLQLIAVIVWKEVVSFIREDPAFNPKDQQNFKKILKKLSVYDKKKEFLVKKGFIKEWGCPNQTLLKIIESYKDNMNFYKQITKIESIYEQTIDKIQENPQEVSQEQIEKLFINNISQ